MLRPKIEPPPPLPRRLPSIPEKRRGPEAPKGPSNQKNILQKDSQGPTLGEQAGDSLLLPGSKDQRDLPKRFPSWQDTVGKKDKLRYRQKTKSNPRERVPLTSLIKNTTTPPPYWGGGLPGGQSQNFPKEIMEKRGWGRSPTKEWQKRADGGPRPMKSPPSPPGCHWLLGANENANTKKVVARQREL